MSELKQLKLEETNRGKTNISDSLEFGLKSDTNSGTVIVSCSTPEIFFFFEKSNSVWLIANNFTTFLSLRKERSSYDSEVHNWLWIYATEHPILFY